MTEPLLTTPKSALQSRAVIGGLIAVGAGIAGLFGIDVDSQTQSALATTAIDLASAVGGLLAIWGRMRAKTTIGK